jgi:hypothetical protein
MVMSWRFKMKISGLYENEQEHFESEKVQGYMAKLGDGEPKIV